jgi:hypothetical protein
VRSDGQEVCLANELNSVTLSVNVSQLPEHLLFVGTDHPGDRCSMMVRTAPLPADFRGFGCPAVVGGWGVGVEVASIDAVDDLRFVAG